LTSAWAWALSDRGLVRTGFKADLVLFDEQWVRPAMPKVETRRELVRRRR
jgi:N-acyl-D-aspartate/D-glutamate deacylase